MDMQSPSEKESNDHDPLIEALNDLRTSAPVMEKEETEQGDVPSNNQESDAATEEHEHGIYIYFLARIYVVNCIQ